MILKGFFLNILIRILLIAFFSFMFAYFLQEANREYYFSMAIFGIIVLVQIYLLVLYVNKVNKQLSRFFTSLTYKDESIVYTKNKQSGMLGEFYEHFDKINDIIQKAKAESERHSLYLQNLVDHVSIGLMSINENGKIELFNKATQKLLQINRISDINSLEKDFPDLYNIIKDLKPGNPCLSKIIIKKEILQLSIHLSVFKTEDKQIRLISLQNIANELERNELESWQKLIRILTHEIMNSISPVTALTSTISRYFKKEDKITARKKEELENDIVEKTLNGLNTIEETGNNLLDFVSKYRSLTALPLPQISKFQLSSLFNRMTVLMEEMTSKNNIDITIELKPENLQLNADQKQIELALRNLIKNSIQALKEKKDKKILLKGYSNTNERVVIEVIDNGPGISDEEYNNIFIPFYSTKDDGSGIGLSLSRQIMQMHQGVISFTSEANVQTVFSLRF